MKKEMKNTLQNKTFKILMENKMHYFILLVVFSSFLFTGCAKFSDAISSFQNENGDEDEVIDVRFQDVDTRSDLAVKKIQDFKSNLYDTLRQHCSHCHADLESPRFAQNDVTSAYAVVVAESLIDMELASDSLLVNMPLSSHNCSPSCSTIADEIKDGVQSLIDVAEEYQTPVVPNVDGGTTGTTGNTNTSTGDTDTIIDISGGGVHLAAFETHLHPVLVQQCADSGCHSSSVTPTFAHSNIETAYSFISTNSLVNLSNAASSRLAKKPLTFHKCTTQCQSWSDNIVAAIELWATDVADSIAGAGISGSLIISKPLTLAEGIKDEGQGRVEDAVIAKYEFKTGEGKTAFDTSGVFPPMDLELIRDVVWIEGRGVDITDPNDNRRTKLIATQNASTKLYKRIAGPEGTKQFSIEAWIINGSAALDGPARIVSYSLDGNNRNFTMGQDTDYYNFRNRSDVTGPNGASPALETDNNASDLKTQLQHVVFTFDQENGRNIFVNGIKTSYEGVKADPAVPAKIANWDQNYRFVLGNEVGAQRQWLGKMLFVAIHERVLSEEEIIQNTLEGIGDRFILEFDISSLLDPTGTTKSTIRMVVSELDEFSYVFGEPALLTNIPSPNIPVKNMRIAINGNIPAAAQSFRNVNISAISGVTQISPLGAVIPKDTGPETDRFSIVFEVLGNNNNVVVSQNPVPVVDTSIHDPSPENGVRTFAQVNNTMAILTGVDQSATRDSYLTLEQQLPGTPDLGSFVTSNQVGIAKLSLDYCDIMVEDPALRSAFYGDVFEFASPVTVAFSDQIKRDIIISNTVNKFVGTGLTAQPTLTEIQPDLDQLITELSASCLVEADCDAARTQTIVKAVCASVLASAAVSIN